MTIMLFATVVAVGSLVILILTVINNSFGLVLVEDTVPLVAMDPAAQSVAQISRDRKVELINEHLLAGVIRKLEREKPLQRRSNEELDEIIIDQVMKPQILQSWSLLDSLGRRAQIMAEHGVSGGATASTRLEFRFWLHPRLLVSPQSSEVEIAGVRTAVLGSLWMMVLSILLAFPIGVATAIYLEEYASKTLINRIVQVNIYNLAGIPSIIYGLLGLVVFVRLLEPLTSGHLFQSTTDYTANGRTIISAGATLALLILPIIIISAQEAIRATPQSLRDSSYGVGATKWQTVWYHVLPNAIDRIITGAILAVSRAVGETAPLVVVGASTFVALDPKGLFSKFTTLPIQIYQWSSRPEDEFRRLAAAAILVLLILLLSMNAFAIILRNHYSKKRRLLL